MSTSAKAFDQRVVETMARLNKRPIIFALSNPTDHAECTAEEAYNWSDGRALFAAGVPFAPVTYNGKVFVPGQGNNLYVFPAVALAVYATQAKRVPDELFIAAARGVAEQVTAAELDSGLLYPPQSNILDTEMHAAVRVAEAIFARGLAGVAEARRHGRLHRVAHVQAGIRAGSLKPAPLSVTRFRESTTATFAESWCQHEK